MVLDFCPGEPGGCYKDGVPVGRWAFCCCKDGVPVGRVVMLGIWLWFDYVSIGRMVGLGDKNIP